MEIDPGRDKALGRTAELRMAIARSISDGINGLGEHALNLPIDPLGRMHDRCETSRTRTGYRRCLDARCDRCYPATGNGIESCLLCGHRVRPLTFECGWGTDADGNVLCHPNKPGHPDCYTLATRRWQPMQ